MEDMSWQIDMTVCKNRERGESNIVQDSSTGLLQKSNIGYYNFLALKWLIKEAPTKFQA